MSEKSEDVKILEEAVTKMSPSQRTHLQVVVKEIIACYANDEVHGVVLIGRSDSSLMKLITINANDLDASNLLQAADEYVNYKVMEDAPPKEKFN